MPGRLIESLANTPEYAEIFSDTSLVQAMLDFEAALAKAESSAGVIPATAADAIAKSAKAENFAIDELAARGLRAGTLSIPLVKALTERVRAVDQKSARFVHWGATSQDVSDTAMALLLRRARTVLAEDAARLQAALRRASDEHANTVMLGRTLLQAAPPITLGLKIAGWFGAVRRSWKRVDEAFADVAIVQFGGAVGTLASLGDKALPVAGELAKQLGLALPPAPWHAQRDRLAAVVCSCGIYVGALAKMAKDISLLMQSEVAEVFEPGGDGRGGSSAMPQKRNPIACALALAAGNRVPGYVASFLSGMPQEQERGVGGWHAEAATIARTIEDTGLALNSMQEAAGGLRVDRARMEKNIASTQGAVFAERAMMMLGAQLGRDSAHALLEEAVRQAEQNEMNLTDTLAAMTQVTAILPREQLSELTDPKSYLGAAETFRKQLLASDD
ncbi:MAG TPA: adenylosuccinate lyase family protein [Candidatus Aquilonibacter sp.]|nr:adenylosuccinate lyase family protein [Candidatus Aquilonibacter sp.]